VPKVQAGYTVWTHWTNRYSAALEQNSSRFQLQTYELFISKFSTQYFWTTVNWGHQSHESEIVGKGRPLYMKEVEHCMILFYMTPQNRQSLTGDMSEQ
jgi:hypothetical protein